MTQTNFAWGDYWTLAKAWQTSATDSENPAALYRSAISRAYYALFHASFDVAQALGLQSTRSAGDHYRLRKFFDGRGRIATQLSFALRTLYDLRVAADYEIISNDLVTSDPAEAARQAIDVAQKALMMIENLQTRAK